jgi:hypothetical protein
MTPSSNEARRDPARRRAKYGERSLIANRAELSLALSSSTADFRSSSSKRSCALQPHSIEPGMTSSFNEARRDPAPRRAKRGK